MTITQTDIYNYLHDQLPTEYSQILSKLRIIKDPIPHPGKAPNEISNEYVTVGMDGLAEQIRYVFSIPGIQLGGVKLGYFKPHDEHVVEAEDWVWNSESGDDEHVTFDRVVPAQLESVGITYQVADPHYRRLKYEYDSKVTAHQQSASSRREHIEYNRLVEHSNNEIIRNARTKNIELWRTVAKALSAGETPNIKDVKIQMLKNQLAALEENNSEKE